MINAKLIKYPYITSKTIKLLGNNQYSFIVDRHSNKITIKKIIESLFKVEVIKVNSCNLPRKKKRVNKFVGWKPKYKKAIVTLSKRDTISLFTNN